jgi:exosortase A
VSVAAPAAPAAAAAGGRAVATRGWRVALPLLALVLVAITALHHATAGAMAAIWWRSDTFAHAMLVPPIVAWLVWRRRAELAAMPPRPAPWVAALLAAAAAAWLVAEVVVVGAGAQFAFVAMLVLAVPAVVGLAVARRIGFALGFAFFAVPFGEFLLPALMEGTADFTVLALRASGIPVYREGLQFVIPSGNWSVVEACSGVRYLIASFMVGTLYAHLNYRSTRRRLVFMGVSILVPILANWLRAYMIVMLGHLSDNRIAVGVDHLIYGWVFFGVVIAIMFVVGMRWSEPEAVPVARVALPLEGAATTAPMAAVAVAVVTLAAAPIALLAAIESREAEAAARPVVLALPEALPGGWRAAAGATLPDRAAVPPWAPRIENPSVEVERGYVDASGREVRLRIAYFRDQGHDRKLVSSQHALVSSEDKVWNRTGGGRLQVPLSGGGEATLRTTTLAPRPLLGGASGAVALRIAQVHAIDGRFVEGDAAAKLANAFTRLAGRGDDGALIILATDGRDPAAADAALAAFFAAQHDALRSLLDAARRGEPATSPAPPATRSP